jgi:5-deoxy-D-glucuronate isomerase
VHDSLRWTVQQRGNWRNYQPGQVVTLTKSVGDWKAGETATVARAESGKVVVVSGNKERVADTESLFAGRATVFRHTEDHIVYLSGNRELHLWGDVNPVLL